MSLIKPSEFARLVRVSESTIRRYIRDGYIQVVRIGKTIRIDTTEAARLLKSSKPSLGNEQSSSSLNINP